jgi:hypothetical protein
MSTKKPNLYFAPAFLLCLHLTLAFSGLYFYMKFQSVLESRTADYEAMKPRLQQIDEPQLNKDTVLEIMSGNLEDSKTFVYLFRTLAEISALASLISIRSLIDIYRYNVSVK